MRENSNQHGRREAEGQQLPLAVWWSQHREWVAGLDRSGRLRYRLFQVLVAVAAVIIALFLFLRTWIKLPEVPVPPAGMGAQTNLTPGSGSQGGPDVEYEGAELPSVTRSGRKPGFYTFLVAGRDVVSGGTDTIILITYDTKGKAVSAISLLRDTMINTSASSKRLNAVFSRNRGDRSLPDKERTANGMSALKQEVSKLTGIYPDFYVLVEWEAIGELVDALGGVYFDVPPGMDYDDPYQDLHIHQEAGYRLLDGRDAMEVIRFRKNNSGSISLGDIGRTQIQRDFLTAVLKKCLTPEILLKLPTLAQIFMDNVDTDLTIGNILAFAQLAVGMDTENSVKLVPMPFYNVRYGGAAMVCAQQDELLEVLNDGLNPYADEIQDSDLQLMYQKSAGGFGVTNGTLADPAVANPPAPKRDEPEEPDIPEEGTDAPEGEGPDTSAPEAGSGEDTPGTAPGQEDPGQPADPGELGAIDPADIFPDPSQDIRSQGRTAADGLNMVLSAA